MSESALEAHRITVQLPCGVSAASRLEYCVGVRLAASIRELKDVYEPGAYVPADTWFPVKDLAPPRVDANSSNTVALVSVPPDVPSGILDFLKRTRNIRTSSFNASDLTPEERTGLCEILAHVPGIRIAEQPNQVMRFLYPAGLPTATNSGCSGLQVGLHVDIWERLGWRNAWKGANRISINMSRSARYFVFLPVEACRLASVMIENSPNLDDANFDLATEYLRQTPQAVLYRLRVEPGEAYMAPAENVIHDGIPVRTHLDDTLVVLGRFELA